MKPKIKLSILLLFIAHFIFGQLKEYDYQRKINSVNNEWHKVKLPEDIFNKAAEDLHDIRIYGVTEKKDTIEIPYLIDIDKEENSNSEMEFKLLNQSKNNKGYYFTYEILSQNPINEIQLDFKENNFDWLIQLEGSQNQKEWFGILEDYRILSIKNNITDYSFTRLNFPDAQYKYFRTLINSEKKPDLNTARINLRKTKKGKYNEYSFSKNINDTIKNNNKITEVELDYNVPLRLNYCLIEIEDNIDFYRPITLKYLIDSTKTLKGWKYNYRTIFHSTLNSVEKNEFKFNDIISKKIKIEIHHFNNEPLTIKNIITKGYEHSLIARFPTTENNKYYLAYGNKKSKQPIYDIHNFSDKIPENPSILTLGKEQINKSDPVKKDALFTSKLWLWGIMILIILILGGFSIHMMKNKS